jgi:Trypsin-co-occurring domain 2
MGTIGLAEALAMVRGELARAQDEAGRQFQFEITEAEAEFLIEIGTEGGEKAGGSIGVVSRETGSTESGATHRLTVKLRIKDEITGGRNREVRRDQVRGWDEGDDAAPARSWDEGDKPRR